jgi:hypothetical protein
MGGPESQDRVIWSHFEDGLLQSNERFATFAVQERHIHIE